MRRGSARHVVSHAAYPCGFLPLNLVRQAAITGHAMRSWIMGRLAAAKARFLAVAYFEGILSYPQCWQIHRIQRLHRAMFGEAQSCGALCVERCLLPQEKAETIERQHQAYLRDGKSLPDPLSVPPRRDRLKTLATPRSAVAAACGLFAFAYVGYYTQWHWATVFGAASIISLFLAILPKLAPGLLEGSIPLHRPIRWLVILAVPMLLTYCACMAYSLRTVAKEGAGADINVVADSLWLRCWTSALLALVLFICLVILVKFRHREIWYLEGRIQMMQGMVASTRQIIEGLRALPNPTKADVLQHVEGLVERAAKTVRLNPWEQDLKLLGRVRRRWRCIVGVSVWYLEPNALSDEGFDHFDIRFVKAPGCPVEVNEAFQTIKQKHTPIRYDESKHKDAVGAHTNPDGTFNKKAFLRNPDRKSFISVSGFVFHRQRAEINPDARSCPAFDRSYMNALDGGQSEVVRQWLDFRSIAAYPVFGSCGAAAKPSGVLVAFKTVPNAFTPDDHEALLTASRLIGMMMQFADSHEEAAA